MEDSEEWLDIVSAWADYAKDTELNTLQSENEDIRIITWLAKLTSIFHLIFKK